MPRKKYLEKGSNFFPKKRNIEGDTSQRENNWNIKKKMVIITT